MLDVAKGFNTEKLIEYLGRKDLKLDEDDIKILCLALGPAKTLTKFIEGLGQKLRHYSSYKTLDDLKEMLLFEDIDDDDKVFEHCMEDIILKLSNVETITNANEPHFHFLTY
ncbi:hypothetical protein RhiirA4_545404 [Rhizophagus irregularis]|uniref:Uncharacterized protein n=1 Tax=Rhizophagus irregularis TaxID=588596 RepID=A0A2I1GSU6_9GLOM|nr:hypothetical protein RhiirA4_545404 [Rhizophagus irregularis]